MSDPLTKFCVFCFMACGIHIWWYGWSNAWMFILIFGVAAYTCLNTAAKLNEAERRCSRRR